MSFPPSFPLIDPTGYFGPEFFCTIDNEALNNLDLLFAESLEGFPPSNPELVETFFEQKRARKQETVDNTPKKPFTIRKIDKKKPSSQFQLSAHTPKEDSEISDPQKQPNRTTIDQECDFSKMAELPNFINDKYLSTPQYRKISAEVETPNFALRPVYDPNEAPCGIPNSGNACYRLASLQALFAFPFFARKLEQPITQAADESQEDFAKRNLVFKTLRGLAILANDENPNINHLQDMDLCLNESLRTTNLINDFLADFGSQEDAAAFVEGLIYTLGETYTESTIRQTEIEGVTYTSTHQVPGYKMVHIDPIPETNNLQELVNRKFSIERTNTEWKPDGAPVASSSHDATFQLVGEPKEILPIQIKKFRLSFENNSVRKIETHLTLPETDLLDMSLAYGKPASELQYKLKSFVIHIGTAQQGHYIAFVKRGPFWFECNDSSIRIVSKHDVDIHKKEAYLLFFEKEHSPASMSEHTKLQELISVAGYKLKKQNIKKQINELEDSEWEKSLRELQNSIRANKY
ncbi:MAG: hypothetical protein WCG42_06850 [Parachlamydiaceae bacterium]